MNLFSKDDFIFNIKNVLRTDYAVSLERAKPYEIYNAVSKVIMKLIGTFWESDIEKSNYRKAYYLSSEYLMCRSLGNNIANLQIYDDIKDALSEIGLNLNEIENIEEDAGLGNGGLGRLAACFLDSAATHRYPLNGYGIRYEYGLFKQTFENGFQVEKADDWLRYGDPWSIRRESESVIIRYSDQVVRAVPYDTPIIGYQSSLINTLRLWKSEPLEQFDFNLFNSQEYDAAIIQKNRAEDISRVLYPNDDRRAGKILRLKQQYFFVSASIQDLIHKHLEHYKNLDNFHEFNSLQLNDTHPAVAIAEFVRLLVDEHGYELNNALNICKNTFNYTNHTILSEALEKWDIDLYREILPRIVQVIELINLELMNELDSKSVSDHMKASMSIISNNMIHMSHLAIFGSKFVNGVAAIHTEILKDDVLHDWYTIYPEKFLNKTNGITQRWWLLLANPELTNLLEKTLGNNNFLKDLSEIEKLNEFVDDKKLLEEFSRVKKLKKEQLAEFILKNEGISINPNSIFDVQIKRLHEYKRQLLNILHVVDLYLKIKDGKRDIVPRTFIFGAKAFPGYYLAKAIIKFITAVADKVNNDKDTNDLLKVVFVTNYNVSYAQKIFPAADLSEQISTAGKEASGTGNMKFMINGAPTIGTLDGANVEIVNEAGIENNFIFGLTVDEVNSLRPNYNPSKYYSEVEGLKRAVDSLIDGTFSDDNSGMFKAIYDNLVNHDPYMVLADFDSYRQAQKRVNEIYKDKEKWNKMCLMNLANSSMFSSDRTIYEYCNEIWDIKQVDR